MILRKSMFIILLALFVVVGCSESEDPLVVEPEATSDQKYLFDVYYINAAAGYQLTGTYIDDQGRVVSYDHSFARWIIESPESVSVEELNEKFSAPVATIGTVDVTTLTEMFAKIEAASLGELSDLEYTGNDAGAHIYSCYEFDRVTKRYVKVLLSQTGDFSQMNLSPEAIELKSWLESVIEGARK